MNKWEKALRRCFNPILKEAQNLVIEGTKEYRRMHSRYNGQHEKKNISEENRSVALGKHWFLHDVIRLPSPIHYRCGHLEWAGNGVRAEQETSVNLSLVNYILQTVIRQLRFFAIFKTTQIMHGYILVAKKGVEILELYQAKHETPPPPLFLPSSFFLSFPGLNT